MYLKNSKIRQRAKEKGYRISPGFINQLDATVDLLIDRTIEYSKPKKTLTAEALATYLQVRGIK